MTLFSSPGLEHVLGIDFSDKSLLQRALTHRSFLNEHPDLAMDDNERLEFLGDAVLDLVVAQYLYRHYPDKTEGELTALRAALVRTETLADFAQQIDLGAHLQLGRGEAESGGRERPALLCSAFEALVGALYLDRGIEAATDLAVRFVAPVISDLLREEVSKDAKSRLQEWSQGRWHLTPAYRTVAETGPDHAKVFTVEVMIGDQACGQGTGPSKQIAEQSAAEAALARLKRHEPLHPQG